VADLEYTAAVRDDGSSDQLAASIAGALDQAFKRLGPRLAREFGKQFSQTFTKASGVGSIFDGIVQDASRANAEFRKLGDALSALARSGQATRASFGDAFDPRNLDAFESSLDQILRLQEEVTRSGGDPELLRQLRQIGTLAKSELTATRTQFQQTALAARESAQNITRDSRQEGRERIADKRAESARFVTETQTAAARELAIIRSSAQQQVAATQAAAKRRAAAFELVGRVVRSTERVIRSAFDGTANVVSSAFSAIRRGATNTTTNIRQAFSSTNNAIRNDFSSSNSSITNSYRSSFRRNTDIVNNELGRQESRVREFTREATEEISSIGVGRLAGFAAVGALAGRALTSGFRRAATLEDSERALTALLGSVEQAQELRSRVLDVVTGTPFALDQFANAATQLVAFNLEAEKVPRVLQAVADAAAVRGGDAAQTIESLVRVFGQIQSSGRLTGEDLNQLSEAGIPALQVLGNAFGKLGGDMRDMISDGAVPAEDAIRILTDGILEGSDGVNGATAAFGGLAQQLGTTLRGSIGNFNAAFARLGATIITKFQPLLVNAVQSGTEAVDVLASAFSSLGNAVADSPVFAVVGRVFENLGSQIEGAGERIKPVLDFLAEGLVAFATLAGGLAGLRRLPLLIGAIGFAVRRLLSPFNLLVTAGVLVSGFISRLVRESPDLASALGALGDSLGEIGRIASRAVSVGLDGLAAVLDRVITPAVGFLSEQIVSVAVPALERLNSFIQREVIPVVQRAADFVKTDLAPAIGRLLGEAIRIGRSAFESLVNFIRDEVIPVVGPLLERAVAIGRRAFEATYDFLSGTFLPFVQNNLVPVLAGLGAAVGALALTGGNLPLAALVGAGAGIAAALSNPDIRNALINNIQKGIDEVRERLGNLFDASTLRRVGVGVLKVANTIGRTLGNALSDRRLLAGVAGVAAAAVAVAGAFAVGFVEGVVSNIPEIIDGIGAALTQAFIAAVRQAVSNPAIAALAAGLFASGLFLRSVSRSVTRAFQTAVTDGLSRQSQVGASTLSNFTNTLFGGPDALSRSIERQYQAATATVQREQARLNRVQTRLTGFEDLRRQNPAQFTSSFQDLTRAAGATATAAGFLRQGLSDVSTGLRNVRTQSGLVVDGLRSLGQGVRLTVAQFGQTAGVAAGAAFAGAFLTKAAFDVEATGTQRLQGAVGALSSGLAAGLLTGNAGVGAGVAVVSLLGGAFLASRERAEQLQQAVKDLGRELTNLSPDEAASVIDDQVLNAFLDASTNVKETLIDLGIAYEDFAEAAASGRGVDFIAAEFEKLGPAGQEFADALRSGEITLGRIDDAISGNNLVQGLNVAQLQGEIKEAGLSVDNFERSAGFLGETLKLVEGGIRVAGINADLLGTSSDRAGRGMDFLRQQTENAAGAADVAAVATQAFRDKVTELNDARIEGFRSRLDEAKSDLDEAGRAADEAKEKLRQFLAGETGETSIEQSINNAIIATGGLGDSLNNIDLSTAVGTAEFQNAIQEARTNAANILADVQPINATEAANAVAGLKTAIDQSGASDAAKAQLKGGIDAALAEFASGQGQNLLGGIIDAQAVETELATAVSTAQQSLQTALDKDPLEIPIIVALANEEFKTAGQDALEGYASGFDGEEAQEAARQMALDALAAAEAAQDSSSPSKEYAKLGRFAIQGYAQGISGAKAQAFNASFQVGVFAMQGFRNGIAAGAPGVINAARAIANAAAQVMRDALEVESPSKVTSEIGEFFGDGLAEGIDDSTSSVLTAAVRLANQAAASLGNVGRQAAKAIGRGLAEEGPSFIRSIGSAMDGAFQTALSKAEQFKLIGNQIGLNLFGQQGLAGGAVTGGGGLRASLEQAFLRVSQIPADFGQAIRDRVQRTTDFFGGNATAGRAFGASLSASNGPGRENREAFLAAGQGIRQYAEELLAAGRPLSNVVGETAAWRDQLANSAISAGASADEVAQLINLLGLSNTQLSNWVKQINGVTAAARAAEEAERKRIKAELDAETAARAREERARASEERARAQAEERERRAEEAARIASVTGPAFRDLVISTPTSDPEAVALSVANRVALSIRR
jgi:tape measure domain-containing protein